MRRELKAKLKTYFQNKIGAFEYTRGWLKSDCPICGAEYKFGIHLRDNRTNCFVCGYNQSPINLVMHLEDESYFNAIKIVEQNKEARYYEKPVEILEKVPVILPKGFRIASSSASTILGKRAYHYLTKVRGFSAIQVKKLKFGYVLDSQSTYYNHVIIPYYRGRKLVYFQARNMGIGPKFNNPKVEDFGLSKKTIIYNVDAIYRYSEISIVESAFNAATISPKASAILSKTASPYQLDILNKAPVEIYNIILDPDAYDKALKLALFLVSNHKVRVIRMPIEKDVNDMGYKYTMKAIDRSPIYSWGDLVALKQQLNSRRFKYVPS